MYILLLFRLLLTQCLTLFAVLNYYFQFISSVSKNSRRSVFRPSARRLCPV